MADERKRKASHGPSFAAKKARIGTISEAIKKANSPKGSKDGAKPVKSVLKSPKLVEPKDPTVKRKRKSAADFVLQNDQSSDEGWDDVEKSKKGKGKSADKSKKPVKNGDVDAGSAKEDEIRLSTPSQSEKGGVVPTDFVSPVRNGVKALKRVINEANSDLDLGIGDPMLEHIEDSLSEDDEDKAVDNPPDAVDFLDAFNSDNEQESPGAIPVEKLPKAPRGSDVATKKKSSKNSNNPDSIPGTIWLSRIPHGFYERQLRHYFQQFGPITRLRLSRNRKTGASKHYAFLEFASKSVAEIVAKTMNNYLLYGHLLKCELITDERLAVLDREGTLWRGANQRFRPVPRTMLQRRAIERPKEKGTWERKVGRERGRREAQREKLTEIGYEFEAPELEGTEGVEVPGEKGPVPESDADGESGAVEHSQKTAESEEEVKTITADNNDNGDLEIDEIVTRSGKQVKHAENQKKKHRSSSGKEVHEAVPA